MTPGKRICQRDGCEVEVTGRRDKRFCSRPHAKRSYHATHREEEAAYDTAYYAAHREKKAAYRAANRDRAAAHRAEHREEYADYARWYRTTVAGVLCTIRSEAKRRGTR